MNSIEDKMLQINTNQTLMKSYKARCLQKIAFTKVDNDRAKAMRDEAVSELNTILNSDRTTEDERKDIIKEFKEYIKHDLELHDIREKLAKNRVSISRQIDAYLESKID